MSSFKGPTYDIKQKPYGVLLGIMLILHANCTLTTPHQSHGLNMYLYSSPLLNSLRVFQCCFINSYPCGYAKIGQMTFVTLWPDVVTNHCEDGTHIDDNIFLREHWSKSLKGKHSSILVILPLSYVFTPSGKDMQIMFVSSRELKIWKDFLSILQRILGRSLEYCHKYKV